MQTINLVSPKQKILLTCLVLAPLLQLVGDCLWVSGHFPYAWNVWREASYLFFTPVGFLLAKKVEQKNKKWAIAACALYVAGCYGSATMMPLFRLGAFYPVTQQNAFPSIVQSVLDQSGFAFTLYVPGLCFPVSLFLFGLLFFRHKLLPVALSASFCLAGILFWTGNAGEVNSILVLGDAWLLFVFCWFGYLNFSKDVSSVRSGHVYPLTYASK